ncbi:MAG: hypothetical protein IT370_37935 [Deltaproteobacteria bacterium]|nr:hypothetical protein [Deltaproteobacteria bacterium]
MTATALHPTRPWLRTLVSAVVVMNLLDAVFTLIWVTSGQAVEANPLMAAALERSPLWFMVSKLTLVSFGVFILWRARARRMAVGALALSLVAYCVLMWHHLSQVPALVTLVRDGLRHAA